MKTSIRTFFLPFLSIFMLFSCESKQEKREQNVIEDVPEEEYQETIEILLTDSINQEDISTQCVESYQDLSDLNDRLLSVKSPDLLIKAKKEYIEKINALSKEILTLDEKEKAFLLKQKEELDKLYVQTCREYEIPANGVIDNLNNLISRVDQIKTKEELDRFENVRIGMLHKLDDLYLCVEQNSTRIPEVKRLSQILKNKYETKKNALQQ